MEPKAYGNKQSIVVIFWAMLFTLALEICLLLNPVLHWFDRTPVWQLWLIAIISMPLSLKYLVLSASHLARRQPTLTIDGDGIHINTLQYWGHIAWSEISGTQLQEYRSGLFRQTYFLIHLRDKEKAIRRLPRWQRFLLPLSSAGLGSPIFFSTDMVNVSFAELQLEIENRLYERRRQHQESYVVTQPDVSDAEPLRIANR